MNRRFVERFEAALQKIHDGLSKPRSAKRIGRLKERSHGVGLLPWRPREKNLNALALIGKQKSSPKGRLAHPGV